MLCCAWVCLGLPLLLHVPEMTWKGEGDVGWVEGAGMWLVGWDVMLRRTRSCNEATRERCVVCFVERVVLWFCVNEIDWILCELAC